MSEVHLPDAKSDYWNWDALPSTLCQPREN